MTVKRYDMEYEYSIDINVLPTHEADGAFVSYEDYAELQRQLTECEATVTNLEAQVHGLAAESAALKASKPSFKSMMAALDAYYADEEVPESAMLIAFNILRGSIETPNTDAELAEIRAQGVDLAIEHLTKKFEGTGGVGVPVMALEHLASELRKEQGK